MEKDSTLQETLAAIDASIAASKLDITKGVALKRLKANPDFQLIVIEGLINSEAKFLFNILTDPSGVSPLSTEELHLRLEALSYLKGQIGTPDFKGVIEMDAEYAPGSIEIEQDNRDIETATVRGDA